MVINENNTHINSFTKGMNSDTAYDQIQNSQYTFAKNIRITKNQSLGGASDYSTLREGIVTPVPEGELVSNQYQIYGSEGEIEILSVDSVDDIHILVCSDEHDNLLVERINLDDYQTSDLIWKCNKFFKDCTKKEVSTVLYKELDNVVKLYIATGIKPIIELRIDDNAPDYTGIDVDYLINNRIIPQDRVYINDVISGRLPASQVQYTYRFYNKYGNTTQLAPLTNKIQIIDSSRDKEIGNAEGTETSKGLQITIPVSNYKGLFDRMQVFRLTYIKPNEDSEISLIYDDEIKGDVNTPFILNDVGIEPLNVLTIEEFSAMSGLILVPKHIENNQNYMFCANVQDDTIIKDLNINTDNEYLFPVYTKVFLCENYNSGIPTTPTIKFSNLDYIEYVPQDVQGQRLEGNVQSVKSYFEDKNINSENITSTYNDMFTSSLLRSLRRGENYKYGIIYYDKYGRRSDVKPLGSKNIDEISFNKTSDLPFIITESGLVAQPIGMKIQLPQPYKEDKNGNRIIINDIIGCQIVRRSSSEIYQKTLLQVALSRPVRQALAILNDDFDNTIKYSPYYPTGFLTTRSMSIMPAYYSSIVRWDGEYFDYTDSKYKSKFSATTDNSNLFQIFSSEINYRRDDVLEKLSVSNTKIKECLYLKASFQKYGTLEQQGYNDLSFFGSSNASGVYFAQSPIYFHKDQAYKLSSNEKESTYWTFNFFETSNITLSSTEVGIKSIKDVKIPNWSDSYINIQRGGDNQNIIDGIKKYKSFTTTIGEYTYNNWISSCKYDIKVGKSQTVTNQSSNLPGSSEFLEKSDDMSEWFHNVYKHWGMPGEEVEERDTRPDSYNRCGYIGPGPSCFLITTDDDFGIHNIANNDLYTSICNIQHSPKTENIESDEQVVYYGFGNYFKLVMQDESYKVVHKDGTTDNVMIVFDGDIYITPHEFTTMYKTYNFESADTLQSTQITNYIPLESKVNTYFDYGKNLLNTNSANLIYEPGSIEGIVTQERPTHQYNMIYSDNDASNDVFTLISTDQDETNLFKQRAYFSEPKTNGEFIDNYQIFKPASFIDVDSKYGPITHMVTDKNSLFYWQENAFGKFSVNERSLINDQNGNTIMLGQAGILSRYDYISTKYGMREGDMCACPAAQKVFWVDINNKAIVAGNTEQAINYGEQLGVQNIINSKISEDRPYVHFDLQNDELLCKINESEQLIFNTKYNIATSLYTRNYIDILNTKNHLYGLHIDDNKYLNITKYNYLTQEESKNKFLSPMELQFVVNPNASITKVFDSQQIVPIKRSEYKSSQIDNLQSYFKTDLYDKVYMFNSDMWTDREGNILYNVPRFGNKEYGNRLRGKWMEVDFNTNAPEESTTISHVITKFRQSFS